jgi:protein-disulfide isomerase
MSKRARSGGEADEGEGAVLSMAVSEKRDHILGPSSAGVTLVEYGDYECPYCGAAHLVLKKLMAQMGDGMRLVFRNFPLKQIHPYAMHAALAAEAAGGQGRFWEMHDMLFEHQQSLEDEALVAYAGKLGLDVARFEKELEEGAYADRVREDFLSGARSGVNGTPTFFINGQRFDGAADLESLSKAMSGEGKVRAGGERAKGQRRRE